MYSRKQILFGSLSVAATLALAGGLDSALALDASPGTPPPAWHGHGRMMADRTPGEGLLQVLRGLNLSDAQRQQVRAIMEAGRPQGRAEADAALNDLPALGDPGNPGHAAAVQAAQAYAAMRIQRWDTLQQQVYAVLTPAQQAQLPQLLATLRERMAAHAAAR